MVNPKCPLCGAKSSWVTVPVDGFGDTFHTGEPDKCFKCREDEKRWEKDWIDGPDIVDSYAGRTFSANPFSR